MELRQLKIKCGFICARKCLHFQFRRLLLQFGFCFVAFKLLNLQFIFCQFAAMFFIFSLEGSVSENNNANQYENN